MLSGRVDRRIDNAGLHYFEPAGNVGMQERNKPLMRRFHQWVSCNAAELRIDDIHDNFNSLVNRCTPQQGTMRCGHELRDSLIRWISPAPAPAPAVPSLLA